MSETEATPNAQTDAPTPETETSEPVLFLTDLLDELIIPEAPPPISMAPETAGWFILLGLVIAALGSFAFWRWRHWKANAYRRAALSELALAKDDPAEVAELLRRVALARFDRKTIVGLNGEAWVSFLETSGGTPWDEAQRGALLRGPYEANPNPSPALSAQAAHWIKHHRVDATP